jgi:two-component system response regulator DesR
VNTPSPKRLSVLCVDDNELVAGALGQRFKHEPSLHWAGWQSDGSLVRGEVERLRPDVVLMDIDMPGMDAFALAKQISDDFPDTRVVMFSGHVQAAYIEKALDSGAWGYLSKNEDTTTLIDSIRRVGAGEIVLSREAEAVHRRSLV